MKRKILSLLMASALVASCSFSSCSFIEGFLGNSSTGQTVSTVTLTEYTETFDIHSQLQKDYLFSQDPAVMASMINGRTEYSKPVSVQLTWEDTVDCNNYTVTISETEDFANPKKILSAEKSVEVYNLKIATTYYWKVTQNIKDGTTSKMGTFKTVEYGPRNLYIDGVTNVRDVGGWMSASGTRMVQGLMYRGAKLNESYSTGYVAKNGVRDENCVVEALITAAGKKTFTNELGIKTEIDLRATNGNGYPGGSAEGSVDQAPTIGSVVEGVNYIAIPMNNDAKIGTNKEQVKLFFETLADKNNYPIYYHCNIGMNRTGMVSFLLGAICGVDEQTLYYDYMFSNFGTIALPTPWDNNRQPTALWELTSVEDGVGAAGVVNTFPGKTLQEKAENCLKDCGVTQETLDAVRNIMLGQ